MGFHLHPYACQNMGASSKSVNQHVRVKREGYCEAFHCMLQSFLVHPPYAQTLFPGLFLLSPGLFSLLCSASIHFSDHLMPERSARRSHISETFLLSGEVCGSNREASVFCGTGAAEWILTVLYSLCRAAPNALRHLSSHCPHTAIWRHLSQLEAHLLFLLPLSLIQHTTSAMRTKMMLLVTWVCFLLSLIQNNKMGRSFPNSRLKLNAKLVTDTAGSLGTCWWDITTYFKLFSFRIWKFSQRPNSFINQGLSFINTM